ncbi:MAG: 4-alpha-glucanotransferase [Aminobacteriaceae bacterium]
MLSLNRTCGVLLPVFSLPGRWGIGDLGKEAIEFAEFLSRSGQRTWQLLPLSETDSAMGDSPYSSSSAFAGNRLFIPPEDLMERGLITPGEAEDAPSFPADRVDYQLVREHRVRLLSKAFSRFTPTQEYYSFLQRHSYWVQDHAVFSSIKKRLSGLPWSEWPEGLRLRREEALAQAGIELREAIDYELFVQFLFFENMELLRRECEGKGIELMGDLPIYVNYDSADVWAHRRFFLLDADLLPSEVSGVPPDYFSSTGQLWGNPLYNWEELEQDGFSWWITRLKHSLSMFHLVRIDHFRGLSGYWAVPRGEKTAERGVWRQARPEGFFNAIRQSIPSTSLLAENLGVITPDVTEAMESMGLPGMAVLLFGFSGDMRDNPHIPHNYTGNLTAYSGTHDNNTALGWYREDTTDAEREALFHYTGRTMTEEEVPEAVVRIVLSSVAERAIIPLQDHLGLGSEARINTPATPSGNWRWRALKTFFTEEFSLKIKQLAEIYGRN